MELGQQLVGCVRARAVSMSVLCPCLRRVRAVSALCLLGAVSGPLLALQESLRMGHGMWHCVASCSAAWRGHQPGETCSFTEVYFQYLGLVYAL